MTARLLGRHAVTLAALFGWTLVLALLEALSAFTGDVRRQRRAR